MVIDILALSIIGGIILLILLLLIIPVKLRIALADDKLKIDAGWLFLWTDLYPKTPAKRVKKPVRKKRKKPPKLKKKKRKSIFETLEVLLTLMRQLRRPWNILRRHIVFSNVRAYLVISGDDAHGTAIDYAKYSTAVFGLLALIRHTFIVKKHEVFLYPDFAGQNDFRDVLIRIRVRPIFVVAAGLSLLFRFVLAIKRDKPVKVQGGKKYEPTASRK